MTEGERQGNELGNFCAQALELALRHDKFLFVKNPAPSGRYPKIWDLPRWKALLKNPRVQKIPWACCAWNLHPSDGEPGDFYQKRSWGVCTRVEGLEARLGRACPGRSDAHRHVPLSGSAEGAKITRCQEAGQY